MWEKKIKIGSYGGERKRKKEKEKEENDETRDTIETGERCCENEL